MSKSIQKYLLVNLFLSVTLVTTLAVAGNLYLSHRNFQTHLDSQLTMSAYTIDALLSKHLDASSFKKMQRNIDRIPSYIYDMHSKFSGESLNPSLLMQGIQFQIWDQQGHLLLHSHLAPLVSMVPKGQRGFFNGNIKHESWRILSLDMRGSNHVIHILQRHDFRAQIEKEISEDSLTIMLITYPFLGLLIWLIVGQGLSSIRYTARALRKRQSFHLKPIAAKDVPSEIMPLVEELNKLFGRLTESFNREKRFAADAAHELRTPLAALRAQAEVAIRAKDIESARLATRKVIDGVDRSSHVMTQLLILSRMVPDAMMHASESLSLETLSAEILADLTPQADVKGMILSLEAPSNLRLILGHRGAILILLRNLVDNAIRYGHQQSKVTLFVKEERAAQILEVVDHGPGIAKGQRERVFERFYRVVGNEMPGSGLGLGIVKQIVDLHHAKIHLEDPETHQGLKVVIAFPLEGITIEDNQS